MTPNDYVIWFIITAVAFITVMSVGIAGSFGVFRADARAARKLRRQNHRAHRPPSSKPRIHLPASLGHGMR